MTLVYITLLNHRIREKHKERTDIGFKQYHVNKHTKDLTNGTVLEGSHKHRRRHLVTSGKNGRYSCKYDWPNY